MNARVRGSICDYTDNAIATSVPQRSNSGLELKLRRIFCMSSYGVAGWACLHSCHSSRELYSAQSSGFLCPTRPKLKQKRGWETLEKEKLNLD